MSRKNEKKEKVKIKKDENVKGIRDGQKVDSLLGYSVERNQHEGSNQRKKEKKRWKRNN